MLLKSKFSGPDLFRLVFLPLLVVWLLFLYPNHNPAYADSTLYSQTTNDFQFPEQQEVNYILEAAGNGLSGTVNQICWVLESNNGKGYINVESADVNDFNQVNSGNLIIGDDRLRADMPTSKGRYCATLGTPIVLNPAKYYFIETGRWGNGTTMYTYGSSNSSAWDSTVFDAYKYPSLVYLGGDIYFELNGIPAIPPLNLQIDFPPNATSTPDFSLWSVSGYTSSTGDTIQILSQATSSNTWIIDGGRYLGDPGLFSDFIIVKNTAAVSDIYRAYAILYHGLDIEATSSIITYTITGQNPGTGGYYGDFGYYPDTYPTSTASSSEWVLTCDPNDPFWDRSFCQIAKWILDGISALIKFFFMPKSSDFEQFTNLKTALENKPPMGYFYAIKNALTFNGTTTKAFDLASSTVAMSGPIFDPLKTGLAFILWLLFAFWLFNRIKHFNL